MSRPQRCRKICSEPEYNEFIPSGCSRDQTIVLSIDEYEVIRLVDYEKKTHEQCAKQMDISRTTVTEIYENARYKIAQCIVQGHRLVISGGHYRLCEDHTGIYCGKICNQSIEKMNQVMQLKGENMMRIAVTYDQGEIFQHFGHTSQFKVYDVEDNKIVNTQVVDTMGSGHGALAGLLSVNQVDALVCGGIGGGAQNALAEAGIRLYGGVSGSADEAVQALIAGTLGYNPNVQCSHHSENHSCGEHHCEENKHGCSGNHEA